MNSRTVAEERKELTQQFILGSSALILAIHALKHPITLPSASFLQNSKSISESLKKGSAQLHPVVWTGSVHVLRARQRVAFAVWNNGHGQGPTRHARYIPDWAELQLDLLQVSERSRTVHPSPTVEVPLANVDVADLLVGAFELASAVAGCAAAFTRLVKSAFSTRPCQAKLSAGLLDGAMCSI